MQFNHIINAFNIDYDTFKVDKIDSGNINRTFSVEIYKGNNSKKYLLQKINTKVFTQPKKLMQNVKLVLDSLQNELFTYVTTKNNKLFHIDNEGSYWRMYTFVNNSVTFQKIDNLNLIYESGNAFGNFLMQINRLDYSMFNQTIKNFHNTKNRYKKLECAIKLNLCNRYNEVKNECEYLLNIKSKCCKLQNAIQSKNLPLRIVHNDTKCSNVLFEQNNFKALAVCDLDTVMPGAIAHDFGDGARSICSSDSEESINFKNIYFDLNKFDSFANGFLTPLKAYLTQEEKNLMYLGVLTLTCELSVRFLTDYLLNDVYFKINYPNNNKNRAINQLILVKDIIKKEDAIREITLKYL